MTVSMKRRTFLLGSLVAISAAAVIPPALGKRAAQPEQMPDARDVHAVVRRHFGAAVAASRLTTEFCADLLAFFGEGLRTMRPSQLGLSYEMDIVTLFLQSTTYLAHVETGAPLEYLGLSHPQRYHSQSQLVARTPG